MKDFPSNDQQSQTGLHQIVINGSPVVDVSFKTDYTQKTGNESLFPTIHQNEHAILSVIQSVIKSRRVKPIFNFGLKQHYVTKGNTLELRFIDPENPRISQTAVTIITKDKNMFDGQTILALMNSFDNVGPDKTPRQTPTP